MTDGKDMPVERLDMRCVSISVCTREEKKLKV